MSDIVERLRGLADLFEAGDAPRHVVLHMRAGADEIERKASAIASLLNNLADERTESMRLRAALEPILNYPGIKDKIGSVLYDAGYAALSALEGK